MIVGGGWGWKGMDGYQCVCLSSATVCANVRFWVVHLFEVRRHLHLHTQCVRGQGMDACPTVAQ